MRTLFRHQRLALVLLLGITCGNALPYAMAYRVATAKSFSCHCCSHGKVKCDHCEKAGHKQGFDAHQQNDELAFRAAPCNTKPQRDDKLDFSTEPFLIPEKGLIVRFHAAWQESLLPAAPPTIVELPPTPPPQPLS